MARIKLEGNLLLHKNGVRMGEIDVCEDGFFVWWPAKFYGYLDGPLLQEIADLLKDKNASWQEQVNSIIEN
jgi:hypothetical protein